METTEELLAFDKEHVWHPYTSIPNPMDVYSVASASGCTIKLSDGKELTDGMASWWAAIHGYNHPELNKALFEQSRKVSHIMFGGLTHEPAVRLARKLVEITPDGLDKVFFSDSGSVSVEVAIKMAIQYHYAKDKPEKSRLLTVRGGYHGDTFKAMSVSDPVNGMHAVFAHALQKQIFAPRPQVRFDEEWQFEDISELSVLLENKSDEIAAVIIEPMVQGAGGMWFYNPRYLKELRQICDQFEVLLIFDEIATGFGRTGKLFASEHSNVVPDIMCMGKALTGGYLTLAATMCSPKVAETISMADPDNFMHGPTFMANPLACSVASASIEVLLSYDWQSKISAMESQMLQELWEARNNDKVNDVRVLGGIGVIEMHDPVDMARMQSFFVKEGVWIRPFGKLIYIMPPYIISQEELSCLTAAMVKATTL